MPLPGPNSANRHRRNPLLRVLGLGLCLALLGVFAGRAAPGYSFTRDFVIRTWQAPDGLPDNSVTDVAQTPDGHLWLGTFNGLVRFNGAEFETVADPVAGLTAQTAVVGLRVNRDGRLWVSTMGRGIFVLERGRVLAGTGTQGWPAGTYVRSWTETDDGFYAVCFSGEFLRWTGERWEPLPGPVKDRGGFHLAVDRAGALWAVRLPGVFRWNGAGWDPVGATGASPRAIGLCARAAGGVWVFTESGLWRGEDGQLVKERDAPRLDSFWAMREDSRGRIWITGYERGLLMLHPDGTHGQHRQTTGLSIDQLRVSFEDREGNHWVGSAGGGLMRFRDRRLLVHGAESGLRTAAVNGVRVLGGGEVLVGTQGGGFVLRGEDGFRPLTAARTNARPVYGYSGVLDRAGWLWLVSESMVSRRRGGVTEEFNHPRFGTQRLNSIHLDAQDRVWVSCFSGLAVWRDGQFQFVEAPVPGMAFDQMVDAPAGGLWVSSLSRGVWHLDALDRWRALAPDQLGSVGVHALLRSADGTLWIATGGRGLARWRENRLAFVPLWSDDRGASVYSLVLDGRGNLWLGSGPGLVRMAEAEANAVADGLKPVPELEVFGRDDGLVSLEFQRNHQPTAVRTPDGLLLFASPNGLVEIDPAKFGAPAEPPAIGIRGLRYRLLSEGPDPWVRIPFDGPAGPLRLPAGSSFLEFDYAGLEFTSPETVHYRFRLLTEDGVEGLWREVGGRRSAYYPVIPAGRYRFQVSAARLGQRWNGTPAEIVFEVLPHWWERSAVRGGAGLLVTGLGGLGLWAGLSRRVRRERRHLAKEAFLLDQRREAEAQNRLLRELLDQSSDIVFVFGLPGGQLVDASAAAVRLLGLDREELARRTPDALGLVPGGGAWSELLAGLRQGRRSRFEAELSGRGERRLPVEVDARLSRRGDGEFVVAIARDISERRRAEERQSGLEHQLHEAQKMEAVGRLAGGVAHDFNNLLQVIQGFTEIVRMSPEMAPAERDENLGEVSRAAGRASELTRQLLAFSRRDAVKMERCRLEAVVEQSLKMLRPLVGPHVQLHFQPAAGLPPIMADAGQLGQVLLNLAANARDALPEGGQVTLRAAAVGGRRTVGGADLCRLGRGHSAGAAGPDLRAVLHHEGAGQGHWARACGRLRGDAAASRADHRHQPARGGNHLPDALPGMCRARW